MRTVTLSLLLIAVSSLGFGQDGSPAGAGRKPDAPPAPKAAPKQEAVLDEAAEAWINVLAKRIVDGNQIIRESAVAGLEKVGKPALPTLNRLATDQDKVLAEAAKKLADKITKGPQQTAREGQGGRRDLGQQVDAVAKELKLDEAKTKKLKDLQKAAEERMREGRESVRNGEMTPEEAFGEMRAYHEEVKKELRKFLSEDEAKAVEEKLIPARGGARRRAGGGGGNGGNGGGGN